MRHLDMIKGRDGLGGFSMSENALPIFNQLIKLKICCCIKLMSRLFRMSSMQIYYNATTLIEARHVNSTIAYSKAASILQVSIAKLLKSFLPVGT